MKETIKRLGVGGSVALALVISITTIVIVLAFMATSPKTPLEEPEFVARYDIEKIWVSADEYVWIEDLTGRRTSFFNKPYTPTHYFITDKDEGSGMTIDIDHIYHPDELVINYVEGLEQSYVIIEIVAENKITSQMRYTFYLPEEDRV